MHPWGRLLHQEDFMRFIHIQGKKKSIQGPVDSCWIKACVILDKMLLIFAAVPFLGWYTLSRYYFHFLSANWCHNYPNWVYGNRILWFPRLSPWLSSYLRVPYSSHVVTDNSRPILRPNLSMFLSNEEMKLLEPKESMWDVFSVKYGVTHRQKSLLSLITNVTFTPRWENNTFTFTTYSAAGLLWRSRDTRKREGIIFMDSGHL